MKTYILLAHPDSKSFNGQLAEAYVEKMTKKGHQVRFQKLGEMQFDPILNMGYNKRMELEPDLKQAQENIKWCDHWVIFYPVWWGNVPAIFKGFLDRTMLPGFAFKYHESDPYWDKLLKGRTTELITTSDAPSWWLWLVYGNSDLKAMKHATLEFCGFKVKKTTRIGDVKNFKQKDFEKWIAKFS